MSDDLGLFRDTTDRAEQRRPQQRIYGRRARRQIREQRRRRVVLGTVLAVLVLAIGGVLFGVRELQAWRAVPDFVGAGGAETVVQV